MIEKLTEGEMIHPIEVGKKINEIIEALNNHYHRQASYGLADYDNGYRTSSPRLDESISEFERIHEDDGA